MPPSPAPPPPRAPSLDTVAFALGAGFCAGLALKKVGRAAAVGAGVAFLAVAALRARRALPDDAFDAAAPPAPGARALPPPLRGALDARAWAAAALAPLDADGDGAVSADDVRASLAAAARAAGAGVGAAEGAAFAVAFAVGLRRG